MRKHKQRYRQFKTPRSDCKLVRKLATANKREHSDVVVAAKPRRVAARLANVSVTPQYFRARCVTADSKVWQVHSRLDQACVLGSVPLAWAPLTPRYGSKQGAMSLANAGSTLWGNMTQPMLQGRTINARVAA